MPGPNPSRTAVVFAGGGTGGHILPAIAIAERVLALDGDTQLAFATSDKAIDRESLDASLPRCAHDTAVCALPARPPSVRPLGLCRFVSSWGPSVRASRGLLRSLPERTVVLALGGYVAPPVAQAARIHKRPVFVLNIDAVPGKANLWIKRRAARAFSAYHVEGDGWTRVRPIVRASAVRSDTRAAREELGLDAELNTLLVTGGSQGARTVNDFLLAMLRADASAFDGWQVLHQTGTGRDDLPTAYASAGVRAVCRPFFAEMGACWAASDFAVARAGAGSVSEAWANRVPTLFLPYPFHKDEHQRANTVPLVEAGAAVCATDHVSPGLNLERAGPILAGLLADASARAEMSARAEGLPSPDGAKTIARALVDALEDRPKAGS